jgi:hypothetical protein
MAGPIEINEDDYSFIAAAAGQLQPPQRLVFAQRVHAALQGLPEIGPGSIDRVIRAALFGLRNPPAGRELPSRWSRKGSL